MAQELLVRHVLDLPDEVPECVVNIRQFDDPDVLAQNVQDYVITPRVAQELEDLVRRLHRSVEWHEGGRGHFVHGSFGSGKSHFMATLGLILENHPAIWQKDHPIIQKIHTEFGTWLAAHPVLVIPVYMLGQTSFQQAMYRAANERLRQLDKPPCEFSDARKVIEHFQTEVEKFGDVVYQRFFQESRIKSQRAFNRKVQGGQEQLDELAAEILAWRGDLAEAEKRHLYPDSFVDGMLKLSRHAQSLGYAAVVFFVDELILYLSGKSGREWGQDLNDLGAIIDPAHRADQAVPMWVVVAKQRDIRETVPEDTSQKHIFDHLDWQKDRFPRTTELADVELIPITRQRVLKRKRGKEQVLELAVNQSVEALSPQVRNTLMHDFTLEDFRRVYPFHPALIRTLIDVSNRLSKERAGIRLLYELLIEHYPDLPIGRFVPYAALFDVIFLEEGLVGGATNPELEAVRRTYYDRIRPAIREIYPHDPSSSEDGNGAARPLSSSERLEAVVKTVLLSQLSRTMRDQITVERILHLNYADLRGMTDLGTYTQIGEMLKRLANRADVVVFAENEADPAKSTVSISVEAAPDIRSILKKIPVTDKSRIDAFAELMKRQELLGRTIKNGELQDYDRLWRGTRRAGRVVFTNVQEMSTAQMTLTGAYTIFIGYPWDLGPSHGPKGGRATVERGRRSRGALPIGFWLPGHLSDDDLQDLTEYAKIRELEDSPDLYLGDLGRSAREAVESKVPAFKQAKEKNLLSRLETCYLKEGEVLFLDQSITTNLDVKTMREGLDRIADAALDRLYPHHPRFKGEVDQRSLRRLLVEFLVPASQTGAVKRSMDLDDLLERLGEPLELASKGATAWALAKTSKYLRKLEELAQDNRVKADDVRDGLQRAFGFNRDLCDLFILYLAKGLGYRVLRNGKPVDPKQVDFGKLAGVTLERGQVLQLPDWARVKEMARTWGVQAPVADLSVGAQDQLWMLLNGQSATVARSLGQIESRLKALIEQLGARPEDSHRWRVLQAAKALNGLVAQKGVDSYAGLKALLAWTPEDGIQLQEVTSTIAGRDQIHQNLQELSAETVELIARMARQEDGEAGELRDRLRDLLCAPESEHDLAAGMLAWRHDAARLITDRALGRREEGKKEEKAEGEPADEHVDGIREIEGNYVVEDAALLVEGVRLDVDTTPITRLLLAILEDLGEPTQEELDVNLRMKIRRAARR
jgi:hypothetical protein